jgi:LAO/AO transport system kinase
VTIDVDEIAAGVLAQDRRSLAKAITAVESTHPEDRLQAIDLLDRLLPHAGSAIRLGVSGPPGAGKSTFIEALGSDLVGQGLRVAVLAIDPSSATSGGSVLGDKTRMERLAVHPDAFIRPSPSGGTLGGVARRTREAGVVLDASGFDVVIVETVGVGQSETAVSNMVDCFLLLLPPGGGDELQGIKRGIIELADIVVVTKSDGDLAASAARAEADYRHAIQLLRPKHPGWAVPVQSVSARDGHGIAEVWSLVQGLEAHLRARGLLDRRRADQAARWMWDEVDDGLRAALLDRSATGDLAQRLEADVRAGTISAGSAASALLEEFRGAAEGSLPSGAP